ncbi:FtsQ-type POTRA domain-containing protein [Streptomyces sp. ST2-7A]|uniref:cell division protein FtsQ/DivIB n=1 Tax=Streptomyces sp. ST2-7A TaxID=2907214 RepID=UPI001F1B162B|nr:FtsQ-type POTRA domain-containing protein [Streptomyces sp. ST2-7A]MCE7083126.1 FtsQ-type POTRA domain-containing protein [Streptomyces sp. ST2-7A]
MVLLTLLVLLPALTGFALWALYGSNWLRIERVSVEWTDGPRELAVEEVERVAAVPIGAPLASLDTSGIRDRLLAELPRLADARVSPSWPHGVELEITERVAVLQERDTAGFTEIDATGTAFGEVPEALPGVPLLEMEPVDGASLRRFGEEGLRAGAVAVAAALPDAVAGETAAIRVGSYDSITLELSDGRTVLWGSSEDPGAKSTALTALMTAAPGADRFDVSVPGTPAADGVSSEEGEEG